MNGSIRSFIAIGVLSLLCCAAVDSFALDMTVKMEENIISKTIEAKQGELFSLELVSNRSTGYAWQLAAPLDETMLQFKDNEYQSPDSSKDGASGTENWRFLALKAGKTVVSLKYVRSWEISAVPVKTAVFTIIVK